MLNKIKTIKEVINKKKRKEEDIYEQKPVHIKEGTDQKVNVKKVVKDEIKDIILGNRIISQDVFFEILQWLKLKELFTCMLVCRAWNQGVVGAASFIFTQLHIWVDILGKQFTAENIKRANALCEKSNGIGNTYHGAIAGMSQWIQHTWSIRDREISDVNNLKLLDRGDIESKRLNWKYFVIRADGFRVLKEYPYFNAALKQSLIPYNSRYRETVHIIVDLAKKGQGTYEKNGDIKALIEYLVSLYEQGQEFDIKEIPYMLAVLVNSDLLDKSEDLKKIELMVMKRLVKRLEAKSHSFAQEEEVQKELDTHCFMLGSLIEKGHSDISKKEAKELLSKMNEHKIATMTKVLTALKISYCWLNFQLHRKCETLDTFFNEAAANEIIYFLISNHIKHAYSYMTRKMLLWYFDTSTYLTDLINGIKEHDIDSDDQQTHLDLYNNLSQLANFAEQKIVQPKFIDKELVEKLIAVIYGTITSSCNIINTLQSGALLKTPSVIEKLQLIYNGTKKSECIIDEKFYKSIMYIVDLCLVHIRNDYATPYTPQQIKVYENLACTLLDLFCVLCRHGFIQKKWDLQFALKKLRDYCLVQITPDYELRVEYVECINELMSDGFFSNKQLIKSNFLMEIVSNLEKTKYASSGKSDLRNEQVLQGVKKIIETFFIGKEFENRVGKVTDKHVQIIRSMCLMEGKAFSAVRIIGFKLLSRLLVAKILKKKQIPLLSSGVLRKTLANIIATEDKDLNEERKAAEDLLKALDNK